MDQSKDLTFNKVSAGLSGDWLQEEGRGKLQRLVICIVDLFIFRTIRQQLPRLRHDHK